MKTLLIIFSLITLSLGVSAQRKGYHHAYRSRIVVVPSISYGIGYGYPYFGYPYFGYPYGYFDPFYQNSRMPYRLSLQIQTINDEYRNKIKDTRRDKSLSHTEKRKEIRSLKNERDQEIINAKRDFSRPNRMNHRSPDTYNQDQSDDNS